MFTDADPEDDDHHCGLFYSSDRDERGTDDDDSHHPRDTARSGSGSDPWWRASSQLECYIAGYLSGSGGCRPATAR